MTARTAPTRAGPEGFGVMRKLTPLRPWQVLNRYLYELDLAGTRYTVEVDIADDDVAKLYADGRLVSTLDLPASFAVGDGRIDVAASLYGVTRVHFSRRDGVGRRLTPVRGTLEDRRRRLGERHPVLSRVIGWVAIVLLIVNLILAVPFALEIVTEIPVVAERFGTFVSPIQLPVWANTPLLLAGIVAAMERALTLRHNKILDMETIWTSM
ncbi:hypothetical protein CH293_10140 [Rhodococcus sp. 14-2470-1b]|nr:hypothetical protein CH293_10140 [Rhodococcus sp. 14-2470-1b]